MPDRGIKPILDVSREEEKRRENEKLGQEKYKSSRGGIQLDLAW